VSVARPQDAYAGGGDWNRSDAHLRGEDDSYEKDKRSIDGPSAAMKNGLSIPASVAQDDVSEPVHPEIEPGQPTWDPAHLEGGNDFVQSFHLESPTYDEPALAESESRPGTSMEKPLFLHAV